MKRLKVGVIGLGAKGTGGYGRAVYCQEFPETELVAICDTNKKLLEKSAQELKVKGYLDCRKMITKENIDLVIIATPNFLHVEQSIFALEAGKHVYCEKPMGINESECKRLCSVAEKSVGKLKIGFELHNSFLYERSKKLIDEGVIGNILNFQLHHFLGNWIKNRPWRLNGRKSGGLIVEEICHYIDFINWLNNYGKVKEVKSFAPPTRTAFYKEMVDNIHIGIQFSNGVVALISWSHTMSPMHTFDYIVMGTKGVISTDLLGKKLIIIKHKLNEKNLILESKIQKVEDYRKEEWSRLAHNVKNCIRLFAQRILDSRDSSIKYQDSAETMKICFAARESVYASRIKTDPLKNEERKWLR